MCGRAACSLSPATLREKTGAHRFVHEERYAPSHNLCPGRFGAVLVSGGELHAMRWGLTMAWDTQLIVNARAETLSETRTFAPLLASTTSLSSSSAVTLLPVKQPYVKSEPGKEETEEEKAFDCTQDHASIARLGSGGRCVFLCEGYYEWRNETRLNRPAKQPYYFYDPNRPLLAVAGLYSLQKVKQKKRDSTALGEAGIDAHRSFEPHFTVITVEAAPSVCFVHDRMPALLDQEQIEQWLDPNTTAISAASLLQPTHSLSFHPVADLVSKRFDGPKLIRPLKPKDRTITDFFQRSPPRLSSRRADGGAVATATASSLSSSSSPRTLASFLDSNKDQPTLGKRSSAQSSVHESTRSRNTRTKSEPSDQ